MTNSTKDEENTKVKQKFNARIRHPKNKSGEGKIRITIEPFSMKTKKFERVLERMEDEPIARSE